MVHTPIKALFPLLNVLPQGCKLLRINCTIPEGLGGGGGDSTAVSRVCAKVNYVLRTPGIVVSCPGEGVVWA